jgi:hypothetical protein
MARPVEEGIDAVRSSDVHGQSGKNENRTMPCALCIDWCITCISVTPGT